MSETTIVPAAPGTPDEHRFANALCDGLAGTLAAVDPAAPRQELRHDA